jgi:hypothetical protein
MRGRFRAAQVNALALAFDKLRQGCGVYFF